MAKETVKLGSPCICPHCYQDQQDGPIEDYVIPGRFGSSSEAETECCHCDESFIVTRVDEIHFTIEEV